MATHQAGVVDAIWGLLIPMKYVQAITLLILPAASHCIIFNGVVAENCLSVVHIGDWHVGVLPSVVYLIVPSVPLQLIPIDVAVLVVLNAHAGAGGGVVSIVTVWVECSDWFPAASTEYQSILHAVAPFTGQYVVRLICWDWLHVLAVIGSVCTQLFVIL